MNTIKTKAGMPDRTPSINIERDNSKPFHYITTPNAELAFLKIAGDYRVGVRSFSLVGAYGTGKSSFLLALEQTLNAKKLYFKKVRNHFNGIQQFEFIRVVGTYDSLIESFARSFGVPVSRRLKSEDVMTAVKARVARLNKAGKALVILVDEFGKFLEFSAKNNPEKELYFIQELSELVNDTKKEILLVITLHQDFNGYSRTLTKSQQNEWDKVKGRLREIPFNEPVEQLLFLAAERIGELGIKTVNKDFDHLHAAIEKSKLFPLRDYDSIQFAKKLLPFDQLAAAVMTISLQKYGQNERSVFAFIESHDVLGLRQFDLAKEKYYNLSCVYDYLTYSFYSFLQTSDNPDKSNWYSMRAAIERCEGLLDDNAEDAIRMVKTIGLLNLFGSTSGKLNALFLEQYGKYSLGIKNSKLILDKLQKHKIIRFTSFNQKYVLFEGTDVDIDLAINAAGNLVETLSNVVQHLSVYFEGGFIPAKAAFYKRGTPRFFQFILSDKPEISGVPTGEVDGFINLIFSEFTKEAEVKKKSAECKEAVLFGLFKNTAEISREIYTIEKINKAIENHRDDLVAVRVFTELRQGHLKLLNHFVNGSLYSGSGNVSWYFDGQKVEDIKDRKTFNQTLSRICNVVYSHTPVYKNELLNKTSYSSVISKSRTELIKRLLENAGVENIGYSATEFPPAKSIYLTLLKETGIHRQDGKTYTLGAPTSETLSRLWAVSMQFLESTRYGKRPLKDLADILLSRPFKCKQGLVDFWIPIFLVIKKDDFALFDDGVFIPQLTEDSLDLVVRGLRDFEVKAFQVDGVRLDLLNKYRDLINKNHAADLKSKPFIETIKPFLFFYKGLTIYAQKTGQISENAKKLREAIITSQDPETTFFERFPESFGYTIHDLKDNQDNLLAYTTQLQDAIRQLRTVYFDLLDRFEAVIGVHVLGKKASFQEIKEAMKRRFAGIREHLLSQSQSKMIFQFVSPAEDRNSWMNMLAQACIGKRLEAFSDMDEKLLHDKFITSLRQLDNLCELSRAHVDFDNEDIIKLEITSFVENMKERIIRMPKLKTAEADKLAIIIKNRLSADKHLNIATLITLLNQQLDD